MTTKGIVLSVQGFEIDVLYKPDGTFAASMPGDPTPVATGKWRIDGEALLVDGRNAGRMRGLSEGQEVRRSFDDWRAGHGDDQDQIADFGNENQSARVSRCKAFLLCCDLRGPEMVDPGSPSLSLGLADDTMVVRPTVVASA